LGVSCAEPFATVYVMVPVPHPSTVPVKVSTPLNVIVSGVEPGTRQKSYTDVPCQVSPARTPNVASPRIACPFGHGSELGTALPSSAKWVKTGTTCSNTGPACAATAGTTAPASASAATATRRPQRPRITPGRCA
jgi:hypothetical protein